MVRDDDMNSFRDHFHFPLQKNGKPFLYFCGNSLGLQPKQTEAAVLEELENWKNFGVEGHFEARIPWYSYHEIFAAPMSRIVGALPSEVVIMNGLTVNLHLMMVSFYRPTVTRYKILIEGGAFPSDRYAVRSQVDFHSRLTGFNPNEALLEILPRPGESWIRKEDLLEKIEKEGETIALILLGDVNFLSGQAFDLNSIAKAAHQKGCVFGVDLAHGAGNLPLRLHDWDVDFAVWCSYKYLNAGPGGVAGCFVHESHSKNFDLPRFAGWWGFDKAKRFQMCPDFQGMQGAEGWQLSNPPILQMAALQASLKLFDQATMPVLRAMSEKLTGFLEKNLQAFARIKILTPTNPAERGAQLSIQIQGGSLELLNLLKSEGVLCDFRAPDVFRITPVPLYNTLEDIERLTEVLKKIL